jgi:hypothetical protein
MSKQLDQLISFAKENLHRVILLCAMFIAKPTDDDLGELADTFIGTSVVFT